MKEHDRDDPQWSFPTYILTTPIEEYVAYEPANRRRGRAPFVADYASLPADRDWAMRWLATCLCFSVRQEMSSSTGSFHLLGRRIQPATTVVFRILARLNSGMANRGTIGTSYGVLRKECLEAVRQWPGCETIGGIQIIRDNTPAGFSVRVTLYGKANKRTADRAIACVQREKRRQFYLTE